MKWFLVLLLTFFLSKGLLSAEKELSDLMYNPTKGDFHYYNKIEYKKGESVIDFPSSVDASGNTTEYQTHYKWDTKAIRFNNFFEYGVLEDLQLGVGINYLIKNETELKEYTDTAGTAYSAGPFSATENNFNAEAFEDKGLEDPYLKVNYRILKDTLILDVYGIFSPGFSDAKSGEALKNNNGDGNTNTAYLTENGNAFRGGHQATFGARIGTVMNKLQLMGDLGLIYNFERKVINLKEDYNTTTRLDFEETFDPKLSMNLKLGCQYEVMNKLFLGLETILNYNTKQKSTYSQYEGYASINANYETQEDKYLDYEVDLKVKYQIMKKLLGHFTVGYYKEQNRDYTITETDPTTSELAATYNLELKDATAYKVALGIDFEF